MPSTAVATASRGRGCHHRLRLQLALRLLGLHLSVFPSSVIASASVPISVPGGEVQVTATTRDKAHQLARFPVLQLSAGTGKDRADVEISVDPSKRFQHILGIGAALTDASAFAISRASPEVQETLLQRLFGPADSGGAQLSMLRLTVGVSDFSVSYKPGNITYDDVAGDYSLEHFSTDKDDSFFLPMLRRILAINPNILIMASPWTAPLWLKNASGSLGEGWLRDSEDVFATYAEYFVRFLEDYDRKGVRVHYLTLQNEPGNGDCGTMPCMYMSPLQQIRLGQMVGRRLQASDRANVAKTKLLAYDHNWGPNDGPPQAKRWNSWLLALLLLPVPIIGGLCSIIVCGFYGTGPCLPPGHSSTLDEQELEEDHAEEEEDEEEGAKASGELDMPDFGDDLEASDLEGSDSDGDDDRPLCAWFQLLCGKPGFAHGVCVGAVLMLLASWVTSWLTASLVVSGTVAERHPVDDLSRTFNGINWPAAVLSSSAGPDFAGVAWHCYGGDPEVQSDLLERLAGVRQEPLEQHMTECSGGDWSGPWEGSLVWNQKVLIMGNFHNHGNSVLHWNLALDERKGPHCEGGKCCAGCRGVVTVPSTAASIEEVTYNVEFLGLAHHSSALGPGAQRIFSKVAPAKEVHAVAYQNTDGSLVLVVVNENPQANATIHVAFGGQSFRYNMAPGVVTFKW